MHDTAADTWEGLAPGWRRAFDEAWTSWCSGNLGIGAALVDPVTEAIVAAGRNRVNQPVAEPRMLSGNFMAHAEMNAFASLDRFKADGLDLYTTLEPCLMCAGTAVFLHVERVFHAADDEFFAGIHDLWDHHPYSARNKHESIGPLTSPLAAFARVLPLQAQATTVTGTTVMEHAHRHIPTLADLAIELTADETLHRVRDDGGSTLDAIHSIWDRLPVAT
ncbi:MAG: nucleoside deaminase [Acidimicrobiales bacterium]